VKSFKLYDVFTSVIKEASCLKAIRLMKINFLLISRDLKAWRHKITEVGFHSGDEEEFCLGHKAVYTVKSQPTFRRNIASPSSGLNSNPSKNWNGGSSVT
jgi:hypothetical protein